MRFRGLSRFGSVRLVWFVRARRDLWRRTTPLHGGRSQTFSPTGHRAQHESLSRCNPPTGFCYRISVCSGRDFDSHECPWHRSFTVLRRLIYERDGTRAACTRWSGHRGYYYRTTGRCNKRSRRNLKHAAPVIRGGGRYDENSNVFIFLFFRNRMKRKTYWFYSDVCFLFFSSTTFFFCEHFFERSE